MSKLKINKALIPAAGKGIRTYPKNRYTSKVMLEIMDRPILENTIILLRDSMEIKDISIITGHLSNNIEDYFGDGKNWGVKISYIHCSDPDIGLAKGILLAEKMFQEPFLCILGDEYYFNSNHHEMTEMPDGIFAICAIKESHNIKEIEKNYTVEIKNHLVTKVIEKPAQITHWNLGCGTFLFTPEIFEWIRKTKPSQRTGRVEFLESIDLAVQNGRKVKPFFINGIYFNVNSIEDVNQCNYVMRSLDFDKKKISLIIPAYNEENVISYVIKDFMPHVDEVIVVDNQSVDKTSEVSIKAGAKVEKVNLKGYGDTIRHGLEKASGDILIIVEADFTFRSKDLGKFLEYIKDADMVIGTRTTRQMIEQGANMNGLLRLGNLVVAKLVELFWWEEEPRFTDVGCTYRAIWKSAYDKIKSELKSPGPEFSVEMMIRMLKHKKRVLEIPISYYSRAGDMPKHSGNWAGIIRTASRMLSLIFKERLSKR